MDYKDIFYEVLEQTNEIALATSINNVPNVRIVNFCFDTRRPDVLYFTSNRNNKKVVEFQKNNKVAFATVPCHGSSIPHVRTNNATVQKSHYSIDEVKMLFVEKVPGYDETIAAIGDTLDVFEIHIKEALVILDFANTGIVKF